MIADTLPDGRTPVLLSAHAEDLVGRDAEAILRYLDGHREITDVGDVAATLLRTRRVRRHRAVVRAADPAELRAGLGALARGADHPLVTRSTVPSATRPRVAFVFPGQGTQWPGMGRDAYGTLAVYRAEVDACAAPFAAAGAPSPLDYLLADPAAGAVTNDFTQVQIQGAQFLHGVGLARVWASLGVHPDLTVGHSLGEIGAAYVAGTLTATAAAGVVIARATLLDRLTGPYRVAVLGITPEQARVVIDQTPGWLELSVINSPSSVAISGAEDAVAAAVRTVARRGSFATAIEMWFPAHTTALDPLRDDLTGLLPTAEFTDVAVPFIGSAGVVEPGTDFADYWYANLRSTVRFDRAVATAVAHGAHTFVEMSAHPALLFATGQVVEGLDDVPDGAITVVGSGHRDDVITERLSANLVTVALTDPDHRWADPSGGRRKALRDFPFAPMRADHHWATADPLPPVPGPTVAVEHWEPVSGPVTAVGRRIAVLGTAAVPRSAATTLRDAIDRNADVAAADPADADVLVIVAPDLGDDGAAAAASRLGDRIGQGLLDYVDEITPTTREVWLVTAGGERVVASDPAPVPAQAALAAMHRSIGFEHPDHRFGHLDLPRGTYDPTAAVAAILGDADVVALRGNGTYRRSMRENRSHAPTWTPESGVLDDVLITGGSGVIGMHYARSLAERGARRITLLSRGGADVDALAAFVAAPHSESRTEFRNVRCDLADAAQIAAAAANARPATLLIHAAGTAVIATRRAVTATAAHDTFGAKVAGLDNLVGVWPVASDARILLCSSVSGVWGGRGHAVYSAANRLLDVMAGQMRADGRRVTALRWGLWEGAGVIGADEVARVERSGLRPLQADRAVEESLRDHDSDPMVFAADPRRLRAFLGDPGGDRPAAVGEPSAVDVGAPVADAADAFRTALGSVLSLADNEAVEELDLDASLLDLGVDSLLALDLRTRLRKATGRTVPLATILGGATATEVIELLDTPGKKALLT